MNTVDSSMMLPNAAKGHAEAAVRKHSGDCDRSPRSVFAGTVATILTICVCAAPCYAIQDAELLVSSLYTGPGCCYEFTLSQQNGSPGNFTEIVATINTAGATVDSATGSSGAPAPAYTQGGVTVRFFTRTANGLQDGSGNPDPHVVSICFDLDNVTAPISVTFQAYDALGNTCSSLCTEDVLLSDPSCLGSSSCVDLMNCFTPDRSGALPADTLQVVAFYDGDGVASLDIHLIDPITGDCCVLTVGGLVNTIISTDEYYTYGYVPTGVFDISGVVPNGSVDGVAFGLYWRDTAGVRWLLRSRTIGGAASGPNFVGGWPLALDETNWDGRMPQLAFPNACYSSSYDAFVARRQAQMTVSGAQLLGNGTWNIPTGRVPGDVNGDGCVDLSDLASLLANYGAACCP